MERNIVKTEEDIKFLEDLMKLDKEDIVNGLSDFITLERLGGDETKINFIKSLQRYMIRYPNRPLPDVPLGCW
jgi:transcription antitermination factor NusA-like protein